MGARETRALFQPSAQQRKMLNRSLEMKPFGTLLTTELNHSPAFRAIAQKYAITALERGEIEGEYAKRSFRKQYMTAGPTGLDVLRKADTSIKLPSVVAPGGKSRPIPAAGAYGAGRTSEPVKAGGAMGLIIAGLVALAILR
jgi:hypothetical protein